MLSSTVSLYVDADGKPVVKGAEQLKSFIITIVLVIGLISSSSLVLIWFALVYPPWSGSIPLNISLCNLRYISKSSKMNHPLEVTAFFSFNYWDSQDNSLKLGETPFIAIKGPLPSFVMLSSAAQENKNGMLGPDLFLSWTFISRKIPF